tara:strand:- start:168 stop:926 length:759 start_codon:yes stop_codon:yes gene_type:complete
MVDINKFKQEFLRIKSLGFLESDRPLSQKNDGAVGNTFETNLGVQENNLKAPDYDGWEIKTKRQFTKSATSLFTLKPSYPPNGDKYMRENWGLNDPSGEYPNIKVFRTSVYANRFSIVYQKYQMKLYLDRDSKKLRLLLHDINKKIIDDKVYWSFDDILKASSKLRNLLVIEANEKIIDNKVYFHYINASAYLNFKFDSLLNLIEIGKARYDNRLGIYRSGKNIGKEHNHGGGLRLVTSKDFHFLYNDVIHL